MIAFLKRQNTNYKAKKSLVFAKEEIDRFVKETPDESFLSTKVFGVDGACRTNYVICLLNDLNVEDDIIVINILTSKNNSSRKFVIVEPVWIEMIKKYIKNRPTQDLPKLFISVLIQLLKMPKVIAKYQI